MTRVLPAFLLLVLAAAPAYAVNLVNNPSFAGSLGGWDVAAGTTFDPTMDATGVPGSGSARSIVTRVSPGTQVAISQCITTGPGTYTFGGKIADPVQPGLSANGGIRVSWFSGPDCTTGLLTSTFMTGSGPTPFTTLSTTVLAPPGTTHALVRGEQVFNGPGTNVAHFDDFVLDNGLSAGDAPSLSPFAMILLAFALAGIGSWTLLKR